MKSLGPHRLKSRSTKGTIRLPAGLCDRRAAVWAAVGAFFMLMLVTNIAPLAWHQAAPTAGARTPLSRTAAVGVDRRQFLGAMAHSALVGGEVPRQEIATSADSTEVHLAEVSRQSRMLSLIAQYPVNN